MGVGTSVAVSLRVTKTFVPMVGSVNPPVGKQP